MSRNYVVTFYPDYKVGMNFTKGDDKMHYFLKGRTYP